MADPKHKLSYGIVMPTPTLAMMKKLFVTSMLIFINACAMNEGTEYTLYRSGVDLVANDHDETLRIHVATFDANEDAKYNLANCEFAQELFSAKQPHFSPNIFGNAKQPYHSSIKLKYWCEKGRFRK